MTLQFISHHRPEVSYVEGIRLALEGGCRWVQLRMKEATGRVLYEKALDARELTQRYGAVLIIDDRLDVALAAGADGVHLGQKDLPVGEARRLAPRGFIVGGTANTFEQVREHAMAGADYIGCGPYRYTTTKQGLAPILGLEGYRDIIERMKAEGIATPLIAIGGITADDLPLLRPLGLGGIALSGTILRAADPQQETKRIISLI